MSLVVTQTKKIALLTIFFIISSICYTDSLKSDEDKSIQGQFFIHSKSGTSKHLTDHKYLLKLRDVNKNIIFFSNTSNKITLLPTKNCIRSLQASPMIGSLKARALLTLTTEDFQDIVLLISHPHYNTKKKLLICKAEVISLSKDFQGEKKIPKTFKKASLVIQNLPVMMMNDDTPRLGNSWGAIGG